MYVGTTKTANDGQPSAWFGQGDQAATDAVPPGRIVTITPKLISQQRAQQVTDIAPEVQQLFTRSDGYRIGAGDILGIDVLDHPELTPAGTMGTAGTNSATNTGYKVNSDGLIQFPYAGTLKVQGLTEFQARDLIAGKLAKFIRTPEVTVRVQAYRSGRIYVDGEVNARGVQVLDDIPMTLPEVLARANGLTQNADRSAIAITRGSVTTRVNLQQLLEKGVNPSGILLRDGDMLRVIGRDEAKVYVLGEVSRPGTLTLRDGRLTLNEALGVSGGVSQTSGDPRQIFVVRVYDGNGLEPKIYHLDAQSPAAFALAEGFELKPSDVIYVDPVPVVRWNRVISLVLPSAQAVTVTSSSVNSIR